MQLEGDVAKPRPPEEETGEQWFQASVSVHKRGIVSSLMVGLRCSGDCSGGVPGSFGDFYGDVDRYARAAGRRIELDVVESLMRRSIGRRLRIIGGSLRLFPS